MNTKKIAATITLVAMVTNLSVSTTSVLAHELTNKDEVTNTSSKIIQTSQSNGTNENDTEKESKQNVSRNVTNSLKAGIKKFAKTDGKFEEAYNKAFKVDNSEITSVRSNDGSSTENLMKAFDDDTQTCWSSRRLNSDTFTNEIVVTLKESMKIDTMIYGGTPYWQKGYAEEFEIYASNTDDGDDFKLIAVGEQAACHDIKEITFKPTELKRFKFVYKKGNLNQAASSVFWLYKHDELKNTVDNLFTDGTMVKLKDEYNSEEAINALEEKVNKHPLKHQLVSNIEIAKELLKEEKDFSDRTFTLTQYGNTHEKARNQLGMSRYGTDLQSTGIVGRPGQVFKVFVEAEDGAPLPQIVFSQQEGRFGHWKQEYQLKKGLNVITVPEIYNDSWSQKPIKGGPVYLMNRYTPQQQGKAPVVRIEGGEEFPLYNSGDDKAEFLEKLKAYKAKLDKDPANTVDVYEFNTTRFMYTGTAKAAYQVYVNEGVDVEESVQVWNTRIQDAFELSGLKDDPSDPTNDSTNVRTSIRLMQPYGAAYAASDHIGVQRHIQEIILRTDQDSINSILWGMMHEVGHQLDIATREWGEITNNMYSNNAYVNDGAGDRAAYSKIHNLLAPDDSSVNFNNLDGTIQLGMFWQLQLKKDTYWAELDSLYRKNKPNVNGEQQKRDTLALYSSEVLNMNLTNYFEKYGFTLSDSCKKQLKEKSPNDCEKIWYLNGNALSYDGEGFKGKDTGLEVSVSKSSKGVKLTMNIDKDVKNDLLGYEIIKDGKVIAFTTSNSYTDSTETNTDSDVSYEVVPYALDLTTGDNVGVSTLSPSISVQQSSLVLKLNDKFNPMDYVKGYTHLGEEITSNIKVKSDVDTKTHGNYTVTYTLNDNGQTATRVVKVEVVSDYDYLSDFNWESTSTAWGSPRRNSNISGRINGDIKKFEKGFGIHANGKIVYDLSDKNYDRFEALIGIDTSIQENDKSSVTFKIVADGKTVATTSVMGYYDNMIDVNIPVSGVKKLEIQVYDGGNGNTCDHCIIVNPKLTTNNGKPRITAQEKFLKLGDTLDPRKDVKAHDQEDGDLTSQIQIISNNFVENKVGRYEVVYEVTDSNNNVTRTTGYVTVSEDYKTKRSRYGKFSNLQAYNDAFKLPVLSIKNNAGHYGSSKIQNALDGNINTHWETNTPNSSTFKNEVIFDLGEVQEISRMAYGARRDAYNKGFASKFEIYVSTSESGDDFYLAGSGSYTTGSTNDFVEFKMSNVSARRVKFKFVEAREGWASLCEVAFYKEDKLSDKIESLFTDETKTDVAESYNTLEKLDALRKEVKDHPAYDIFKVELDNAEKIIKAKYPTINVEKLTAVDKDAEFDLMADVEATDQKDGKITSSVVVEDGGFSSSKIGEYTVKYSVTNTLGLTTEVERKIIITTNEDTYISDLDWKSATIGWGTIRKDRSLNGDAIKLLNKNGEVETFEKGIGTHAHSEIVYDSTEYDIFDTWVGMDQYVAGRPAPRVKFKVYVDGKLKAETDLMKTDSPKQHIVVDVRNSKEVKLVVENGPNGMNADHADWADAKFKKIPKFDTTELEKILEQAKELDLNNYTQESMERLEQAIEAGEEAMTSKDQEIIEAAIENLTSTIDSLVRVNLNEVVQIRDEYLKKAIQKTLNISGNVTIGDMRKLTSLKLSEVTSLEGLQHAINLESLNIEYNEIRDLSPLKNLKKLTNLQASPLGGLVSGRIYPVDNKATINLDVINRQGVKLSPKSIIVKHNKTHEIVTLDAVQYTKNGVVTLDTTTFDKYLYTITLVYEDTYDNYVSQFMFMLDNR